MKKIIALLICFLLIPNPASAIFLHGFIGQGQGGNPFAGFGSTFVKQYNTNQSSLDADFSSGTATATFTATRGASNPATYINSSGILQKTTTSNAARWTQGYYATDGAFTAGPGLLFEGASTNLFVSSVTDGNVAAVSEDFQYSGTERWSISLSNGGTVTSTVVDDAPDAFAGKSMSIQITNEGGVAGADVRYFNTNVVNLATTALYTVSFWVKASAVKVISMDTVAGDTSLSTSFTTVANTWIRISKTWTTDGVGGGTFIRWLLGDNGLYTIQFTDLQIEKAAYPSSFIPTTAASLTRNAEALSYPVASNFVGGTDGSIAIAYRPIVLPDEQASNFRGLFIVSISGSNSWKLLYSINANDIVLFETNKGGSKKFSSSSAEPFGSSRYSLHSVIATYSTTQDGAGKDSNLYIDGSSEGSNADYEVPTGSLPASFQIQYDSTEAMILVGFVLFDNRLSAANASSVHTLLTQ